LLLATLLLAGCGGSDGGAVSVEWRLKEGAAGASYETVVYLRNDGDATLRDATLRFSPASSANAPAGVSIGTVSGVSSRFEGEVQTWALGDIAPATDVVFPLGLWFDHQLDIDQAHPIELVMELHSPDLQGAIVSNPLSVRLRP
jgi:hypothetical protein